MRYGIRKDLEVGEVWHKEGKTKVISWKTHLCDNVWSGVSRTFHRGTFIVLFL